MLDSDTDCLAKAPRQEGNRAAECRARPDEQEGRVCEDLAGQAKVQIGSVVAESRLDRLDAGVERQTLGSLRCL